MLDNWKSALRKGAENLLVHCGGCTAGDRVLIVFETETDGYFDPDLAGELADAARALHLDVKMTGVPFSPEVVDPGPELVAQMQEADCTVFLARLGDQIRFRTQDASQKQIISYALDRDMLASPFGTVHYEAFETLKQLINSALTVAEEVRVTCPLGTDYSGRLTGVMDASADVSRKRFPVSVFTPVPAGSFKGRIAQRGFLTGTGSSYYEPYSCELTETLFVNFDGCRIEGFEGTERDVAAARGHYEFVGALLGIDTFYVHSWHVGMHPGCHYPRPASENFERWSGGAFGNPRLLHFHTCGAYPPGEISLNVLDPTVRIDGVAVWEHGRLYPDRIAGGAALLDSLPEMRKLFAAPSQAAGQGPDGGLSFS